MALSFYDASVATYLQILSSTIEVLRKGEAGSAGLGLTAEDLFHARLRDDMQPLSFQVASVCHHSLGAIRGMQEGLFSPPSAMAAADYAGLLTMLTEARDALAAEPREAIEALSGRAVVFRIGGQEMPFTTDNFLTSFSLPNFFFHATTAYALLRTRGVALGKLDFLGQMRMGSA